MMKSKTMSLTMMAGLSIAAVQFFGCSSNESETATAISALTAKSGGEMTDGLACEVELKILDDGTLYTVTIEPEKNGSNHGGHGHHDGDRDGDNDSDHDGDSDDSDKGHENDGGVDDDCKGVARSDVGFSAEVESVDSDCARNMVPDSLKAARNVVPDSPETWCQTH